MYSVYISRILWTLTKFRTLQAVLEVQFFFFKLRDISAGHHAVFFITCNELWIDIVYGFWCAGQWFNRKFPDYFCCHLHQNLGYVQTVDSVVSIFTFFILFCTLTLQSQSDCFVVLCYRWNYSIIEPRGCQNNARRGLQQNEGAAAAAAEPASTSSTQAEGAVAAAAPADGKVPAVSAPAPSPAWKGAGQGSKKRMT